MKSDGKHLLTGEVHIDEYVTGGPEPGKTGRSDGKKKKTLILVEVRKNNTTGRVYCQKINNYKKETLFPIIESRVSIDAEVVTDEYSSYDKLKEKFPKAKQRKSDKGKTFPVVHQQIRNMKGWLRAFITNAAVSIIKNILMNIASELSEEIQNKEFSKLLC